MHANSILLFRKYALEFFRPGLRVLEIGPTGFPSTYQSLVGNIPITWDTLNLQKDSRLTYSATSEYAYPIPDNAYDIVVSGQVLEHVKKIWLWMKELARICKSGGMVITINPVSWPYHECPVDCWRAFPEGMRSLYEDASLEVILSEWGSLEAQQYRRRLPGRSAADQSWKMRAAYRVLGFLGFPVECSFDTITIGRKV
jgi:hypothetical protein